MPVLRFLLPLLCLFAFSACDTSVSTNGDLPDALQLTASATSVPAGEQAALSVTPQADGGSTATLAGDVALVFSVNAPTVGAIVGPDGQPQSVVTATYAEVQAGEVAFLALPVTLESSQPVQVSVALAEASSVRATVDLTAEPNGTFVGGVNFTRLFAAPTAGELAAVEAVWAARSPGAEGYRVEEEATQSDGATVRVISHVVDGNRHYAAVRVPAGSGPFPVLMVHHGGDSGASTDVYFDRTLYADLYDLVVLVLPSYRSEPLQALGRTFVSEGDASPWDRDVDDSIALLDAVLANEPDADAENVGALGFSRGGTVAAVQALRDDRIDALVPFFTYTDFTLPSVQTLATLLLNGVELPLPGVDYIERTILDPLQSGALSYADARQEVFLRSPAFFAAGLPPTQIHQGTADVVTPAEHATRLDAAIDAAGGSSELFIYDGGEHDVQTLPGSLERMQLFFGEELGILILA